MYFKVIVQRYSAPSGTRRTGLVLDVVGQLLHIDNNGHKLLKKLDRPATLLYPPTILIQQANATATSSMGKKGKTVKKPAAKDLECPDAEVSETRLSEIMREVGVRASETFDRASQKDANRLGSARSFKEGDGCHGLNPMADTESRMLAELDEVQIANNKVSLLH